MSLSTPSDPLHDVAKAHIRKFVQPRRLRIRFHVASISTQLYRGTANANGFLHSHIQLTSRLKGKHASVCALREAFLPERMRCRPPKRSFPYAVLDAPSTCDARELNKLAVQRK